MDEWMDAWNGGKGGGKREARREEWGGRVVEGCEVREGEGSNAEIEADRAGRRASMRMDHKACA
eukprot:549776-Rhodomonas_salina.1